jgi:hypothetical protein
MILIYINLRLNNVIHQTYIHTYIHTYMYPIILSLGFESALPSFEYPVDRVINYLTVILIF